MKKYVLIVIAIIAVLFLLKPIYPKVGGTRDIQCSTSDYDCRSRELERIQRKLKYGN